MTTFNFALLFAIATLTFSCAPPAPPKAEVDESCPTANCTEADLNAPLSNTPIEETVEEAPSRPPVQGPRYFFPAFQGSWGMPKAMYEKMQRYYETNIRDFANTRFVTIIDFNQHSSKKRLYLFDLENQTVNRYLTSHGLNSDKNNDGYADGFSNTEGSKQSSLGFYRTKGTYMGKHGYSMRLEGLSSTNSNAEERAIVVHPANYVEEEIPRSGRSWGCPALDPDFSKSIIDRIKGGSVILIDK
jgi:hypothetical protein